MRRPKSNALRRAAVRCHHPVLFSSVVLSLAPWLPAQTTSPEPVPLPNPESEGRPESAVEAEPDAEAETAEAQENV